MISIFTSLLSGLILLAGTPSGKISQDTYPTRLRCEYGVNSMGIDIPNPHLSWNIKTEQKNWLQSAYQIMVADDSLKLTLNEGDVWNTGKVKSSECLNITYAGNPLKSLQKYWWKVKVWDNRGTESGWSSPSHWTMAMIHPGDWKGKWITSDLELTALQKELKALTDFGMEPESEMWSLNSEIRKNDDRIVIFHFHF